jgi:hypothetical protein
MGRRNHDLEAVEFFKTFPDNHLVNNPYKILFGQGDYTCSVAEFTGTMKGPMKGADGKMIPPTNKKFHLEFCTVAVIALAGARDLLAVGTKSGSFSKVFWTLGESILVRAHTLSGRTTAVQIHVLAPADPHTH